jgi:multidrug efflux system outer membrane protein
VKTARIPFHAFVPLLAAGLLASCAVGPDYKQPTVDTPPDWRWQKADPQDTKPKGDWWTMYHDEKLDALEKQALENNQNLKAAVARLGEARAKARVAAADFYPQISTNPSVQRQRTSANAPLPFPIEVPSVTQNSFSVPFDLSYEIDLWGRVRRSFESAQAQAQATVADYQNTLLSLTADVANNYYALRQLDRELEILRQDKALWDEATDLQEKRMKAGLSSQLEVSRSKNERSIAVGDLAQVSERRAELEASIAVLCGKPASAFHIEEQPLKGTPPEIPVGLPSTLLERRPDVAIAERTMASRNAQIGVAYAAFFPTVSLTGQAGVLSAQASDLFTWESHVWSFGPTVSLPLFSGGRNSANLKDARAAYEESVALYRQQVLVAFSDVEQSLAQIRFYREEETARAESLQQSGQVADLTLQKYRAGTGDYFEVITAQRDRLRSARSVAITAGLRYSASIRLIKSLGGAWE